MPRYRIVALEKFLVTTTYDGVEAADAAAALARVRAGEVAYDRHSVEEEDGDFVRVVSVELEEEAALSWFNVGYTVRGDENEALSSGVLAFRAADPATASRLAREAVEADLGHDLHLLQAAVEIDYAEITEAPDDEDEEEEAGHAD